MPGRWFAALSAAKLAAVVHPVPFAQLNATHFNATAGSEWPWAASAYVGETSKAVCDWLAAGGHDVEWKHAIPQHFDNVPTGMLVLIEMATTEGWMGIVYQLVDAVGVEMQPIKDHNPSAYFFGYFFILVGSFFMLNLFVGVVIDTFTRLKNVSDGSMLQTDEQKNWTKVQNMMSRVKSHQRKRAMVPRNPLGALCWLLSSEEGVDNPWTAQVMDAFIMCCIIAKTIVMSMNYFGMSDLLALDLENANLVFAIIFTDAAYQFYR